LHPDRVTVTQLDNLDLEYVYTRKNGGRQTFKQRDIFHVRGPTEDGFTGISVIADAVNTIGVSGSMNRHSGNVFKNGAAVSAVLQHPKQLGDDALKRLRESVDDFTQGGPKAWKAMILEEGMEYKKLGMNNSDAQFLELAEATAVDICMFFGVPPFMVGLTQRSTSWGQGIEQQWLGFVATTLGPDLTTWSGSIDRDLIGLDDPTVYAKFKPASLIKGDIKTRYYAYSVGRQWSWLSANDIRENEDMNPIEGGDEYIKPMNYVPLTWTPPEDEPQPAKDDNSDENTAKDA
jgi:HK97 family phage portal protein